MSLVALPAARAPPAIRTPLAAQGPTAHKGASDVQLLVHQPNILPPKATAKLRVASLN